MSKLKEEDKANEQEKNEIIDLALPVVSSSLCEIVLEAIKFNNGLVFFHCDAFTIPITTVFEWVRNETRMENSPIKYSMKLINGNSVTIQVKFLASIPRDGAEFVEIRANGGGVLGSIDSQVIRFSEGVSVPEFVPFILHHQKIATAGLRDEEIIWKWQYRCSWNEKWQDIGATVHRIVIVE